MKKRVLAIILTVTFILSSFVFAAEAEQSDKIDTAIAALSDLAIMRGYEDGLFYPEKNVTRMEFVALVLRTLGAEYMGDSMKENNIFSDVDSSLWGAGAVNFAASINLVEGYTDGRFGPFDTVTVNQAVKVLIEALGYGELAKKKGYPEGYLSKATELGIMKGIGIGERAATRGEIALLIYNSLEVKLVEEVFVGKTDVNRVKGEGTLLDRLDISVVETIVTGVYGASLSNAELSENEVELSGELYLTEVDASAFLGLRVRAWIKDDGVNLPTLVHIQSRGDESLVITAESLDEDTSKEEIRYYKDGKLKKYNTTAPLVVVYNGKPLSSAEIGHNKYLVPDDGYLLINENQGNGNIIVVWDYDTFVVSAVTEDAIYDIYGRSIKIERETKFSVTYEGVKSGIESIKAGDVLWVAESLDGALVSCIVKNSSVTGQVEGIEEDTSTNETVYIIDGEEYYLSGIYRRSLSEGHSKALKLSVGDDAVFYLNPGGKIAFAEAEKIQKTLTYGYLVDAGLKSGLGSKAVFKVMTTENAFVFLETDGKEKTRFGRSSGGKYITTREPAAKIIEAVTGEYEVTRQLIMYELNEAGNIKELYLADNSFNSGEFSMDEEQQIMIYAGGVLEQKYFLNSKTPVFCVPNAGRYEEQFYATTAANYFINSTTHTVILYDIDNMHVGAVVATPTTESQFADPDMLKTYLDTTNSPVMLIEKSRVVLKDTGEEFFVVSGYVGKNYKEVLVSDTISKTTAARTDLKAGNIIQYDTNDLVTEKAMYSDYDKVMVIYRKIFDCNEGDQETFQTWNYGTKYNANASISTAFGVVSEYDLPYLTLRINRDNGEGILDDSEVPFVLTGGTAILSYDKSARVVKTKRLEDIAVGQKVFIRQRYNNVREVIILE